MMTRHSIGMIFLALACTSYAGNKKLMTKAEAELRELNEKVVKQVSKKQIPASGRIHVTADVKSTKPEPEITNLKVQIISSNSVASKKTE